MVSFLYTLPGQITLMGSFSVSRMRAWVDDVCVRNTQSGLEDT